MSRVNAALIGIALSQTVAGCTLFDRGDLPDRFSEHVEAKRIRVGSSSIASRNYSKPISAGNSSSLAAQLLINRADGAVSKDLPVIVASFADSENVSSTTGFGRMLSQQFSTQLVNNGYKVTELLMRDNIYITENGGEFLLSRKAKDLSRQFEAHAAVVGTYIMGHDTIFVNAKIVDISTNTILAACDFNVRLDENIKKMLQKSPFVQPTTG